jgi:tRNA G18 (ribose-2'-O)-methylase SpoU
VRSLLVDDHQATALTDVVEAVLAAGAPVYLGSREVVAETVGFNIHRGVVAIAHRLPPSDTGKLITGVLNSVVQTERRALLAIVEGVNDHENLGALFRNAAAFGVGGVLLDPSCADPLYRRSVRVSVGHVLLVPFARLDPWPAALSNLRAAGFTLVALAPDSHDYGRIQQRVGLEQLVERTSFGTGVALLLGAEGNGLSDRAVGLADAVVSIPMITGFDSINVATAAAIAFYRLSTVGLNANGKADQELREDPQPVRTDAKGWDPNEHTPRTGEPPASRSAH